MRQKKVWRYYCDHCRKAGCGKAAMVKHERGCTRNPQRVCGFCKRSGNTEPLVEAACDSLEALRTAAGGCPACMLVGVHGLRSLIKQEWDHDEDAPGYDHGHGEVLNFDFKQAAAAWWAEVNEHRFIGEGGVYGL